MSLRFRSYSQQPSQLPPTYEAHLTRFNSGTLKRLARVWVGTSAYKMNKEACAKAIVEALAETESIRAMVERLSAFERAGLGLLKLRGQTAPTEELAVELLMLGLPFGQHQHSYRHSYREENYYGALNRLLDKGLILLRDWDSGHSYPSGVHISQYHHRPEVFSDMRILAHVETVPPAALNISPLPGVESGLGKRPAEVVLRFVALAETLRKLGRIELTVKGEPAKPSMAKLIKTLGWEDTLATESYTPLPNATFFFFKLLEWAGLLRVLPNVSGVGLDPDAAAFFESPYEEQAKVWVRAYRSLTGWIEYKPDSVWLSSGESAKFGKFNGIRTALLMALGVLPNATAWYHISDLSEGIYSRIGERFSLGYLHEFYAPYNATPEQIKQKRREWQEKIHDDWVKNEQTWITRAVTGPLFHLGLVELAFEPGKKKFGPTLFRLTELGRAAIYNVFRPAQGTVGAARAAQRSTQEGQDRSCWVVQPNFDVIVYLDRASASRLAFIERIAERRPSDGATALYYLTRETVYSALQSGIEPGALIETLGRASEYPLPENIRRTLEDWASRRERLAVYRATDVLEFADCEARDTALANKNFNGVPVGDRFIMLSGRKITKRIAEQVSRTIDYQEPLARCVSVSEDGTVKINRTRADLLVHGELACWAEPVLNEVEGPNSADGNRWRITRSSIQRAVGAGWTAESIIESLSQRVQHDIPPLLLVAIRAWTGAHTLPTSVAVASDLILQVTSEEVAVAIAASKVLQPYFRGRLGLKTFLVRHETAEELCGKLAEFGLRVGSDLALDLLLKDPTGSQAPVK